MLNASDNLNLNGLQVLNLVVENLAAAPTSPNGGRLWANTVDGYIYYRDPLSGVNRQLIHYSQMVAFALNQFAAPTAALNLNSQRIMNLLDPSQPQDAATKAYVDAAVQGIKWKDAVRLASTTTISRSGLAAIDGITPVAGDRIALMDGTANAGIWVAAAGAWTRSTDADTSAEILGMAFFVSEGTANGNKLFVCTTDAPVSLNSTALTFAMIGAGTSYTAGTGLTISGSTIGIDTAVVVRKFTALIGNGSATSFPVTHNFNTLNVTVALRKVSTGQLWIHSATATSANVTTFTFGFAPAADEFEVTIHA